MLQVLFVMYIIYATSLICKVYNLCYKSICNVPVVSSSKICSYRMSSKNLFID